MSIIAKDDKRHTIIVDYSEEEGFLSGIDKDEQIPEESIKGLYVILNGIAKWISPEKFKKFIGKWGTSQIV